MVLKHLNAFKLYEKKLAKFSAQEPSVFRPDPRENSVVYYCYY